MWRAGAGHVGGAASVMVAEPPISMFTCWRTPFKDHLLDARFNKRVYRNQSWISPVLLIDGKIAGVWAYDLSRQRSISRLSFSLEFPGVCGRKSKRAPKSLENSSSALRPFPSRARQQTAIDPKLRFPGESSRLPPVRIRCLA